MRRGGGKRTLSSCFSSPVVKFSISSAFLISTVPFVSVCEMSRAVVKTATFARDVFFTVPSGSRPNTIPCTTLLPARLPPMIFTTRTLSTLKFLGLVGMMERAASATSAES